MEGRAVEGGGRREKGPLRKRRVTSNNVLSPPMVRPQVLLSQFAALLNTLCY